MKRPKTQRLAWLHNEIKFDGYRALALCGGGGETRLFSRNKQDLAKKFPQIKGAITELESFRSRIGSFGDEAVSLG
jgi:ATP-dependent DNA ligase